jgi:hypothetical protein
MLKTEDKKHMKEADYKPLNQRQERNRMFNRVGSSRIRWHASVQR